MSDAAFCSTPPNGRLSRCTAVRPLLEYASPVWHTIIVTQECALRNIFGYYSCSTLLNMSQLQTPFARRDDMC